MEPSLFITSFQQLGCASSNNASKPETFVIFYSIDPQADHRSAAVRGRMFFICLETF
jgi:hypothetical protein